MLLMLLGKNREAKLPANRKKEREEAMGLWGTCGM